MEIEHIADDNELDLDFAENPENRCPVILLLDTSSSMSGQPIKELNQGIALFKEEVQKDAQASLSVEVEIITFGGEVEIAQEFVTIENFTPPTLQTKGQTPMGKAIECAIAELNQRKETYRANSIQYYRPWLFALTDGQPTDNWKPAAALLKAESDAGRLSFFGVGVGESANMAILKELSPSNPPVRLKGLDFKAMFQWLSSSMKQVSSSQIGEMVALPPVNWGVTT